jgi:RNA polymerase sigma-70 factor (ECF subfamily)
LNTGGEAAFRGAACSFVYNSDVCRPLHVRSGLRCLGVDPKTGELTELPNASTAKEDAPETVPLERWMERYQAADPHAPSVLVNAISPALVRFFCAQGATREEADDLLQETWLRVHRSRHTYRPGEQVSPWIYAIARHVRVDAYRKKRRISSHESAVDSLPEAPPVDAHRAGDTPRFEELISSLPASQKEVITMLKVAGLSLEQVAEATSSSVGAVKQKAHRAYQRLRVLLRCGEEHS